MPGRCGGCSRRTARRTGEPLRAAAAPDWMSAASFISMAGGLYLQGYGGTEAQAGGLAYVLGWTGGFCLVALFIAPHLRKLQLYTVPDYFDLRYGGRGPRIIAALS